MQEINLINNPLDILKEEWEKLDSKEKSIIKNYIRMLNKDIKPSPLIIIEVNKIHTKYPDFHIACAP
jgi:mRNA-degrading endonuclease RelE of RelBE toxin-antitoxin system